MTDNIQLAMKADYLKVLTENKKIQKELANLKKELAHLKGMIPKDEDIDLAIGGTHNE
jgi:phosphorylcholine metabolism protein LicD|tara:strand:+ start:177 stop:350 length:174 start_codon:yes stop_codon:yes gene_type:complete